ncbi:MAG: Nif11 family protein [Atopobiaceae bacterium]|nr:Nif11 family protein [Atopobiaceae bacterium]
MKHANLVDDQHAKLKKCETPEEILALAQEEGYDLSDAELQEISGGSWNPVYELIPKCPACGSLAVSSFPVPASGVLRCVCHDYGNVFTHTPVGDL